MPTRQEQLNHMKLMGWSATAEGVRFPNRQRPYHYEVLRDGNDASLAIIKEYAVYGYVYGYDKCQNQSARKEQQLLYAYQLLVQQQDLIPYWQNHADDEVLLDDTWYLCHKVIEDGAIGYRVTKINGDHSWYPLGSSRIDVRQVPLCVQMEFDQCLNYPSL